MEVNGMLSLIVTEVKHFSSYFQKKFLFYDDLTHLFASVKCYLWWFLPVY